MDKKTTDLLVEVETRTRQMLIHYRKMQQQVEDLHQKLTQKDDLIGQLQLKTKEFQQKYDRLKTAKYIDMADDDIKDIRGRIRKMVRDIDKCIAMLKTD